MVHHHHTLNYFDSIKWKKRLNKISHKLHSLHPHWNATNHHSSVTAVAAATEKFARHTPGEVAIHSEDLTASQFANLTGIKTNRNRHSTHSIYYDSEDDSEDEEDCHYFSTLTLTSSSSNHVNIWDSKFWQDRKSLPLKKTEELIVSQPLCRNQSEPMTKSPSIIQKGRFKIVWGQDQQEEESKVTTNQHCVEWKRKRASSNGSDNLNL